MERREFMGAMAALFGGVVIAPYRESLLITPAQALWVPIQGEYTHARIDGILKRVLSTPTYARASAEQIIANMELVRVKHIETEKCVFFKPSPEPIGACGQLWGAKKLGQPEILVVSPGGVIEARRPA